MQAAPRRLRVEMWAARGRTVALAAGAVNVALTLLPRSAEAAIGRAASRSPGVELPPRRIALMEYAAPGSIVFRFEGVDPGERQASGATSTCTYAARRRARQCFTSLPSSRAAAHVRWP